MTDYSYKTKEELIRELKLANSRISNYEKYTKERAEKNARLREQAEEMLAQYKFEQKGQEGIKQLLEELNVYKFELEIQNEQLRMTSDEIIKERKKYKELYDKAPIPYITIDQTGHMHDINNEAQKFPGLDKIIYNRSVYDFVTEESRFNLSVLLNTAFESNSTEDSQINFVFEDDHLIWAKVNATVYYDNDHNKKMIRLAITDITKEQEHSVAELKKR